MKTTLTAALTLFTIVFFTLGTFDDAQARRMGGGKSFGGKNSYSQAAPKPTPGPTQQSMANRQNTDQRAALSQRGGLMGMLGGLALGGLLGALFFGGAFEHLNFMDILIFGLIAFLLYKLFARKRQQSAHASYQSAARGTPQAEPVQPSHRGFDTDLLFKKNTAVNDDSPAQTNRGAGANVIPRDFDTGHFLEGAKLAYRRLQQAWDEGELADVRQFTTDKVFAEIQDQFRARQGINRTDILKLNAELLEVNEVGTNTEASVLFDVIMREIDADSTDDARAEQVREIWHFIRPLNSKTPTWYLDGIQQIES
ncbi:MAG TPA: Tim44-like domain-containing protein [Gammaproteobacteria bacterium]|nr:Tim44-like domain-containing protein [Gammaproteobacteria bacterium]